MEQHKITTIGAPPKAHLVAADRPLTDVDFDRIVRELSNYGCEKFQARKISYVSARQAIASEAVETRFNNEEWRDEARPGDWIVTNMGKDRQILLDEQGRANTYVVRKDKFPEIYDRDTSNSPFGEIYRAKGVVDAVFLPGGFHLIAPWGEHQHSSGGYLLRNGSEVYGIDEGMFDRMYQRLHIAQPPGQPSSG
jgi:hypothetical protein